MLIEDYLTEAAWTKYQDYSIQTLNALFQTISVSGIIEAGRDLEKTLNTLEPVIISPFSSYLEGNLNKTYLYQLMTSSEYDAAINQVIIL